MRFSVEYNPPISKHADRFIRAEITPSLTSDDGDSGQYDISFCIDRLEQENQDGIYNQDISYLKVL